MSMVSCALQGTKNSNDEKKNNDIWQYLMKVFVSLDVRYKATCYSHQCVQLKQTCSPPSIVIC